MTMTAQELQDRIDKCNIKLDKLNKKIAKWQSKRNEASFIKDRAYLYSSEPKTILTLDDLATALYNRDVARDIDNIITPAIAKAKIDRDYARWISECDYEIKNANRDLMDVKNTIANYQNKLALVQEQNDRPVVQIFKDFFDRWEQEIIDWLNPLLERLYALSNRSCELHNNRYAIVGPGKEFETEEERKAEYKKVNAEYKEISEITWVRIACDKGMSPRYGLGDFKKYLDNYMLARYNELVNKVTEVTGVITDVAGLHIGNDGSINGIVIGETGKAKIETIVAGGYNQDIVVNVKHGQCRHYRVLVHRITS